MSSRRKRLPVGPIQRRRGSCATPDGVSRNESLRLRRHGSKDAILIESQAIRAAAVVGSLEPRAPNLQMSAFELNGRDGHNEPCVSCNSDRQWPSFDEERAAGRGHWSCSAVEEVGLDMGLDGVAVETTRSAQADDIAAGGAGERPYRDAVLGEEVVGGRY